MNDAKLDHEARQKMIDKVQKLSKGDLAARAWYKQNVGRLSKGRATKANYEMAGVQAGQSAQLNNGMATRTTGTRQIG